MKKAIIKTLKILLPLALGVFLIVISYNQFTAAQIEEIKGYLAQADYSFIALGMLFALLSHLSRAWRWSYMLQALNVKPNFVNNMIAIGSGYAMNLIIPRSGELSRALIVKETDDIPVDQGLGTIIAERVLDFVLLMVITAAAILSASDEIMVFFKNGLYSAFAKAESQQIIYIIIGLTVIILVAIWLIKRFNLGTKVKSFVKGLKEGFQTIWTMQHKWYYLAHTLFIWVMYLLMFYICIHAIPDTDNMSLSAVLCAFVAGSFAVAFTNGGFGAYPYLISNVLVIFGYTQVVGTAFGWIVWLSQTLLVVLLGLVCFALFSWRKKTAISQS